MDEVDTKLLHLGDAIIMTLSWADARITGYCLQVYVLHNGYYLGVDNSC